jgi:hypothetical protein
MRAISSPDLVAVHPRQHDVQHHHVNGLAAQLGQGGLAVIRGDGLDALHFQIAGQTFVDGYIVVADQYRVLSHFLHIPWGQCITDERKRQEWDDGKENISKIFCDL